MEYRRFTAKEIEFLKTAYLKNYSLGAARVKDLNNEDYNRIQRWITRKKPTGNTNNPTYSPFRLSREQKKYLMSNHVENRYPQEYEIDQIAENLGATTAQIKNWFESSRTLSNSFNSSSTKESSIEQRNVSSEVDDLSTEERGFMEAAYAKNPFPTSVDLQKIKDTTNVDLDKVKIWFDHKRDTIMHLNKLLEDKRKEALEEAYQKNNCLTAEEIRDLGDRLGMVRAHTLTWFRRRRTKDQDVDQDNFIDLTIRKKKAPEQVLALKEASEKNKHPRPVQTKALTDRINQEVRGLLVRKGHSKKLEIRSRVNKRVKVEPTELKLDNASQNIEVKVEPMDLKLLE